MDTIGVRELRRDASRWLARVRAGERFVITDRGRPVAELVPVSSASGYRSLVDAGEMAVGAGRALADVLEDLDRDLPVGPSVSGSEALAGLRHDER